MINTGGQGDQSPEPRGLLDARSFLILTIAANIALGASIAAGIKVWALPSVGDDALRPFAAMAAAFTVWWVTFFGVTGALHRIVR